VSPLAELVTLFVNGTSVAVPCGTTVAVALALQGIAGRKSVSGQRRGPLCGIGICLECRVEIDGRPYCRSCQILCAAGMKVHTDG
jgi:D-hydroxyproline dehydrogenase subunit gamma